MFLPYRDLQKQGIVVEYVSPGSLDFGASPTHTKIHVGQLILDWGARRDFLKHGSRGYTEVKMRSEHEIHDEMLKLLGIRVNEPRAGGAGNSNTGNIGWVLVEHAAEISPLVLPHVPIEFAKQLIEGLGLFLIAINSKYVLYPEMFGRLCDHVDR